MSEPQPYMGIFSALLGEIKQYLPNCINSRGNNVILLQYNCFYIIAETLKEVGDLAVIILRI